MPALPALALLGALLVSTLTPLAFATRSVSGDAGVAPTTSTRAPDPLHRSLAPDIIATPGAAVPCRPPTPATPTPTPDVDDSSFLGPMPTPVPDPDAVVDPLLDTMTAAAAATLEACWNAAEWDAVATILTPRFLQTALGIDAPGAADRAGALAALELGPLHIEVIGPVGIWSDGRGAVDILYLRGRGSPVQAVAARWFLIAERGVARFDEEVLLLPPPLGDRVMVGFGIADDQQPLQWVNPTGGQIPVSPVTALHGANRGRAPHTFVLEGAEGETLGVLTLPPWQQGDLVLLDLPAGTYRLHDPAVAGSELVLRVTGWRGFSLIPQPPFQVEPGEGGFSSSPLPPCHPVTGTMRA